MTGPGWDRPLPSDGRRPAGNGLSRQQVLPVVVALACVLVAALVMRVSEPALDFDASRTTVGRPAPLYDSEITVTAVRAGQRITYSGREDPPLVTPGMFVVLDVELAAGREQLSVDSFQLASGDYVYASYDGADYVSAAPGFVGTAAILFEVDPAHIDDLTATIWQSKVLSGYEQRVVLAVGINARNAAQWRASAANRLITIPKYPESRPA